MINRYTEFQYNGLKALINLITVIRRYNLPVV